MNLKYNNLLQIRVLLGSEKELHFTRTIADWKRCQNLSLFSDSFYIY